MFKTADEISKEIETFRTNVNGVNGILESVKMLHDEVSKSTNINEKQLIILKEFAEDINRMSSEVFKLNNQTNEVIRSNYSNFLNEAKVELQRLQDFYDKIIIDQQVNLMNSMNSNFEETKHLLADKNHPEIINSLTEQILILKDIEEITGKLKSVPELAHNRLLILKDIEEITKKLKSDSELAHNRLLILKDIEEITKKLKSDSELAQKRLLSLESSCSKIDKLLGFNLFLSVLLIIALLISRFA